MSFYCPQCNNLYTKILPNNNKILESSDEKNINTETPTPTSVSSSQEGSIVGGGEGDISQLIKKIISGETIDSKEVGNISLQDLTQMPSYKKLTGKQKEAVYNIISDKLSKKFTSQKQLVKDNRAHFECANCGFTEPIKDGTLIMRRVRDTYISKDTEISTYYQELVNAKELPITRAYVCPNKSCKSHDNYELREAVMFRAPNSMKVEYICRACSFHWL
jgi:predicted RNA-binding Zn-ribbon protein involved in translation (DUF1610 family)